MSSNKGSLGRFRRDSTLTTKAAGVLAELDTLSEALDDYHLYHATRAELLRALGDPQPHRLKVGDAEFG